MTSIVGIFSAPRQHWIGDGFPARTLFSYRDMARHQWMTAGSGILHEEFHPDAFARSGGMLDMVQLWVNLPRRDKMAAPACQTIRDADAGSTGTMLRVEATTDCSILVLSGEPIEEPNVGHGPFVMNTEAEIQAAFSALQGGRFGQLAPLPHPAVHGGVEEMGA